MFTKILRASRIKVTSVIVASLSSMGVYAQQAPPILVGSPGTGTVVYSNEPGKYCHCVADGADYGMRPGWQMGDDLHMVRGGTLTSVEFSFRPRLDVSAAPYQGLRFHFFSNDDSDGGHVPGTLFTLPVGNMIGTIDVPDLNLSCQDPLGTDCVTMFTIAAQPGAPIVLPRDVWCVVEISQHPLFPWYGSLFTFPISNTADVGYSHPGVYNNTPGATNPHLGTNFIDYGDLNLNIVIRMAPEPSDTPAGSGITVSPEPGVTLTFGNVSASGATTVTTSTTNPGPGISGFQFLGTFYEIETNAAFNGNVDVCLAYDGSELTPAQEADLRVMHYDGVVWEPLRTTVDADNNIACAVTSSFSAFALGHFIPHPAQTTLNELIAQVAILNVNAGIVNSLDSKLDCVRQALADFNQNNNDAAVNAMFAFISEVEAQRGRRITNAEADALVDKAEQVLAQL